MLHLNRGDRLSGLVMQQDVIDNLYSLGIENINMAEEKRK